MVSATGTTTSSAASSSLAEQTAVPSAEPTVIRRGLRLLGLSVREEPRVFAFALAGSTVYALMTVAAAYVLGWVTQHVILTSFARHRATAGALAGGAALIIGAAVLKSAGVVVRRTMAGMLQYRIVGTYRRRLTRQYLTLPLSWHQSWSTGALLSNANSDVESMWQNLSPFPMACGVVVMLLAAAVLLLLTDWVLAVVGFVVFPLVACLTYAYGRVIAPRAMRAQELRGVLSGVAHDSFDGALVVKTLGREAAETEEFRGHALALRDALVRVGRLRGCFNAGMEALPNLGVLAALLVGSYRLQGGAIDAGGLVRVAYLFTLLAMPIQAFGWVTADMPRAVAGAQRVFRVLDATGEMPYGAGVLETRGDGLAVSMSGVGYGYGSGDERVVDGLTLDVPVGRTVAVVGPTGSGKSTLAGLLVRLVDPVDGTVHYDGVDLQHLRHGEIPGVAALVPQQTFLFGDTVRGNITLGAEVDDDAVWRALRVAQADRFVAALPEGLDTLVGERGASLSGGQRQRLALARALVRGPRLLVLDDATSSVDPAVEQAILAGLSDAGGGAGAPSVLVIAYRRATIALADEVAYLERGRLLARGSHDQLLAEVPGYRDLVTAYEQREQDDDEDSAGRTSQGREGDEEPAA